MTKTKPSFDQQPDGTVTFSLTLPVASVQKEYQHVLREVQKTTEIKGFRKGHAPLELVESQADPSQLYSHVLEHAFPPAYSQFVSVNQLSPLIDPQIVPQKMTLDHDWVLDVKIAIAPEVKVGDYQKTVKSALAKHAKVHDHAHDASNDHLLEVVFDALLAGTQFKVSPLLIDEEAKSALSRLAKQLSSLKLSVTDYAKSIKKTPDELVAEYQKSAEANLKLEFILQELVKQEKPEVDDQDIAKLKPAKGQEAYAKYVLQKRAVLDKLCAL